jgi:S-adenosylmethionine decarboxylase
MQGLHLTADLHQCPAGALMTEPEALRELCLREVRRAGLLAVGELFHRYAASPAGARGEPQGVTGVVLLAESHLALHTWPELNAVTLDVYVCNIGADNSARAQGLLDALITAFAPQRSTVQRLLRG